MSFKKKISETFAAQAGKVVSSSEFDSLMLAALDVLTEKERRAFGALAAEIHEVEMDAGLKKFAGDIEEIKNRIGDGSLGVYRDAKGQEYASLYYLEVRLGHIFAILDKLEPATAIKIFQAWAKAANKAADHRADIAAGKLKACL